MRFALDSGATVSFIRDRNVDSNREKKYTNRYTLNKLFPNDSPEQAVKRALYVLEAKDYLYTAKDDRYPQSSELRVFGKEYKDEDVYIKIRVELVSAVGNAIVLVLSFHYAEFEFTDDKFPYKT